MESSRKPHDRLRALAVMVVASLGIHGALYASVSRERPTEKRVETMEFEVVRPPPPPPKPVEPEPPKAPEPQPIKAPVKIARSAPPPPTPVPPPPPNSPAPQSPTADAKPPVIKVGISLSSTAAGGGFAVGVGNTLYGKVDDKAADPNEVKPYAAPALKPALYVPPTRVSTLPRLLEQPKLAYTDEARRAEIEGQVVLLLKIDSTGRVTAVKVLTGLGYGLDSVAEQAAYRFKFAPATLDDEAVSTELRFIYSFLLE